jgi:hypothetical protein
MKHAVLRLLGASVLGLALLLPPPACAQGNVGVEAGEIFDLDPANGRFLDPLPFDVMFYIRFERGTATSASGRVVEATTANCNLANFSAAQAVDLGPASPIKHDAKEKFLLPAPELRANRPYCFQITRNGPPPQDVVTKFMNTAVEEVKNELRTADLLSFQDNTAYNAFRERLITRLEETVVAVAPSGVQIKTPADSFFTRGPLDRVSNRNQEQFVRILNPASAAQGSLASFTGSRKDGVFDSLTRLTQEASPIVAKLEAARSRSEALDAALSELPPGTLELLQSSEGDLLRIAEGIDPLGVLPAINLGLTTEEEDLRPFKDNLVATRAQVNALRALLRRLLRPGNSLATAAGLASAGSQALIRDAEKTAELTASFIEISLDALNEASQSLALKKVEIGRFLEQVRLSLTETVTLPGTTLASYEVRAGWYISVDAGIGVAAEIEEIFTYIGTNIYFRPVNKKAHLRPLREYPAEQRRDQILKRFALTVGTPFQPIDLPSEIRGVVANQPLILGAGYRLNDSFRATLGALLFKEDDPNPVVDDERFSVAPYLSFSIDWNLRGLLSRMGGVFLAPDTPAVDPTTTDNN